ncbi:MAG: Bax inhibitor-1/YccA family protein [Puniceicoccales bacterium]|jgi:uncharacterized YccA/Bax inhibitor family protein|nr:Bax inhibitor-1/YccA family protein [Puniceicoccales bacterium]
MYHNTSNPILSSKNFTGAVAEGTATLGGTINRCLILLALVFVSAAFSWINPGDSGPAIGGKLALFTILGFVTCIVTCVKKEWAGVTAPIYAIFEGLVLGLLSRLFETGYPGIVFQAILLTFGVAFGMLLVYKTGLIKVTDRFRMIVSCALFGLVAMYVASWIISLFGVSMPVFHSSGAFGMGLSVFVVILASLLLLSDLDFIVQISNRGLPVYMSWFAAFGLMVTLIWLYVEVIRLLARIRDR